MSTKTVTRTIHLTATDSSTGVLLALARTARSVSREIHFLEMAFDALAEAEWTAGSMAQLAIPIIGAFAALVSIIAGAEMLQQRAYPIPVGQTLPGQSRMITGSGPIYAHAGETIGRPSLSAPSSNGGGGGVVINFYDAQMSTRQDVEDTLNDIGTLWYQQYRKYKT